MSKKPIRPSRVALSKHFMLSDFMGCHSVYTEGHHNRMYRDEVEKLSEGMTLAEHILEPVLGYSRISISYGYISDSLSRAIVKYQDPAKPSYHRWDAGAAADVKMHSSLVVTSPIIIAATLDTELPLSRTITYSESPFICLASRAEEVASGTPRRALYENRYVPGQKKPQYIRYPENEERRRQLVAQLEEGDWIGAGYPTYHGGGRRQLQHVSTGLYSVLSDFLYSDVAVAAGYPNAPKVDNTNVQAFSYVGGVLDALYERTDIRRISILSAYESPEWSEHTDHYFEDDYYMVVRCPEEDREKLVEVCKTLRVFSDVEEDSVNNEVLLGGALYQGDI